MNTDVYSHVFLNPQTGAGSPACYRFVFRQFEQESDKVSSSRV